MGLTTYRLLKKKSTIVADPDRDAGATSWLRRVAPVATTMFGADLRSLAVFRIALGTLVLMDLAGRVGDATVLYSDSGVMTRSMALSVVNEWRWSLMLANGSETFAYLFFAATALVAVAVILGYRTRVATVLLWAMVISIHVRNPFATYGADSLMRVLLFWAMLLPLGAAWSLDRRLDRDRRPVSATFVSMASVGLFLQIAFMYWFTILLKSGDEWRSSFTAVWLALGAGQVTSPFGEWLHQFPEALRIFTFSTVIAEIVMPIALFLPFWNGKARIIAIATLMSLHLGIMLTMSLGIFPWASAFCMVCFLPPTFWDNALPRAVTYLKSRYSGALQVLALVSRRSPRWIPGKSGTRLAFSNGVAPEKPGVWTAFASLGPRSAPDVDLQPPPDPPQRPRVVRSSLLTNLFASFCILVALAWNVGSVSSYAVPEPVRPVSYGLGIYQTWKMFSPRPPTATRWHVIVGVLRNGAPVNLLPALVRDDYTSALSADWDVPDNLTTDYYTDIRWRYYLTDALESNRTSHQARIANHLCQNWNRQHPSEAALISVAFAFVWSPTIRGDQPDNVSQRIVGTYDCT